MLHTQPIDLERPSLTPPKSGPRRVASPGLLRFGYRRCTECLLSAMKTPSFHAGTPPQNTGGSDLGLLGVVVGLSGVDRRLLRGMGVEADADMLTGRRRC